MMGLNKLTSICDALSQTITYGRPLSEEYNIQNFDNELPRTLAKFFQSATKICDILSSPACQLNVCLILRNERMPCAQQKNSNFQNFCWMIRKQPISLLKLFLLYLGEDGIYGGHHYFQKYHHIHLQSYFSYSTNLSCHTSHTFRLAFCNAE